MLCLRRILSVVHREWGERIRENTLYRKNWMSCERSPRSSGGFFVLVADVHDWCQGIVRRKGAFHRDSPFNGVGMGLGAAIVVCS